LSDTGWRLDAKINEALLTSGAKRVVLLVHSMGGLVARNYLLNYGAEKVDQVISMGTPYLGSPKVTKVLEIGDNWGVGLDTHGWLGMHPMEFRKLSQNFPSAYALIPSAAWFTPYPFDPGFDPEYLFVDGEQKDYQQTRDFLRRRHNAGLLDAAVTFQTQKLGDWSVLTDQYVAQRIIGTELDTIGHLHYTPPHKICAFSFCITYGEDMVVETNMKGDSTVPVRSAMGVNLPAWDDRYYFIPNVSHTDLPQDSNVQALLRRMLQGELCSRSQVTAMMKNSAFSAEQQKPDQVTLTASGTQVLALGGAALRVCDASQQCSTPRFFRQLESSTELPGVSYESLRHGAMAFISNGGTYAVKSAPYTLKLQGTQADGAAQLRISSMVNGVIDKTLVFEGIPITLTTVATLTLPTGALPDSLTLNYKYDESSPAETAGTLGKLDGDASRDLTPPTISMQVNTTPSEITLTAQDEAGGSGVLRILYSTQSEKGEYLTYTNPVSLGTGANIWAIAMDNAMNVSAPIHYPTRLFIPYVNNLKSIALP
jgi:pimeloyl-ACP methyl ester carboxylesterase